VLHDFQGVSILHNCPGGQGHSVAVVSLCVEVFRCVCVCDMDTRWQSTAGVHRLRQERQMKIQQY